MYTNCPACARQFKVYARQLGAAQGLVKCGYCGQVFNALKRLRDKPLPPAASPPPAKPELAKPESSKPEPGRPPARRPSAHYDNPPEAKPAKGQDIARQTHPTQAATKPATTAKLPTPAKPVPRKPPISAPARPSPARPAAKTSPKQTAVTPPKALAQTASRTPEKTPPKATARAAVKPTKDKTAGSARPAVDEKAPASASSQAQPAQAESTQTDLTQEDTARADSTLAKQYEALVALDVIAPDAARGRLVWATLFFKCVLLLALLSILALQLAWFNRDALLRQYPQFYPWAEKACARLNCTIVRFRDLGAIRVLNRDVRLHPRYQGALLVNATIINTAGHVQPFPVVQLTLFDTNGRALAHRDFHPIDYLDERYRQGAGMQPDTPLHFVLEVAGFAAEAVGFEFNFK